MDGAVSPNGSHASRSLLQRVAGAATERIVDTVDPDIVLDHIDIDALIQRVDFDGLIRRVDLNGLLDRIDVEQLLDRIDVERLVGRIDVAALVARSGVPEIITSSTGQMAQSGMDLVRRQVAGLDLVAGRTTDRLLVRPLREVDESPTRLEEAGTAGAGRRSVTGRYAGPVSRLLAFLADLALMSAIYTGALAVAGYLLSTFVGVDLGTLSPIWGLITSAVWAFTYVFACTVVAGRTPGKWLLGLRIVRADGGVVPATRSVVRAVFWVASIPVAAFAFVPVLLGRRHRAVHDVVAGTAVVHDWGDRPAELPAPLTAFLERSSLGESGKSPAEG